MIVMDSVLCNDPEVKRLSVAIDLGGEQVNLFQIRAVCGLDDGS